MLSSNISLFHLSNQTNTENAQKKNAQIKAKKNGKNGTKQTKVEQSEPMQVEESLDETSESSSNSTLNQPESPKESEDDISFQVNPSLSFKFFNQFINFLFFFAQIPRRKTPPLPSILSKKPLQVDGFDDAELSQTDLSQNKPRSSALVSESTPPPKPRKSVQFATPWTLKSESLINQTTPYRQNPPFISSNDESEAESEEQIFEDRLPSIAKHEEPEDTNRYYRQSHVTHPSSVNVNAQRPMQFDAGGQSPLDPMDNDEVSFIFAICLLCFYHILVCFYFLEIRGNAATFGTISGCTIIQKC